MSETINQTAAAATVEGLELNAAGFAKATIEISKRTDAGKNEKVGDIVVYIPTLAAFGINAEIEKVEAGLPVYKDDKADFLFTAVAERVKSKARSSLVSGTAELKAGASIAEDFEALLADSDRRGGAEALANVRKLKEKMAFWLASVAKKSAGAQKLIYDLFSSRQALSLQTDENKAKMVGYIEQFATWLVEAEPELAAKGERYIMSLVEAAKAQASAEDF